MDLGFLDRSSQVTPLLVRLYDSQKLYGLARDKKPVARAELTDAVSDLLGMTLAPRESELVADVLIGLLRQAEKDLRQALSERLSGMDNVPLRLVLQIANDEIDVAAPVLKSSPVLGDLDLVYIIRAKGPAYWQAIAAREHMSAQVMEILADTKDLGTAMALIENRGIHLTERTVSFLSDIARASEDLAAPLLRREEVTNEIAGALYRHVGRSLKNYIVENYEIDAGLVTEAVADIVSELGASQEESEFVPTESMIRVAQNYHDKGLLTAQLMLGTLRRGQIQSFVAQFSKFAGLPLRTVEEVLMQNSGQGLAVCCKAHGIAKPDFVSIYLLTNRVRNRGKMVDLKDMTRAVGYYDRIEKDVAQDIMRNSAEEISKS